MENSTNAPLDSTPQTPVSSRSIGMTYGLYAGLISAIIFTIISLSGMNPFGGGLNYIGTVASIVLLVLAHKKFKDSGDGYMSYGTGIGITFWFTLISCVIALVVMYVYINFVDYSPMQLMLDEQVTKMQESGNANEEAIEMASTWTKKLFWPMAIVFGIIGGMIIGLIVTIFTQKNKPVAF